MKRNKLKLRWTLFLFILGFAFLIIGVFCFFQMRLFEDFYKTTKTNSAESFIDEVSELVKQNNLESVSQTDFLSEALLLKASEVETAIYLFSKDGKSINTINQGIYYAQFNNNEVFTDIYDKAKATGLSHFFITFKGIRPSSIGSYPIITQSLIDSFDSSIIRARFVNTKDQEEILVIADSRLTPVKAAVDTFKLELIYIIIIVSVLSFLIALMISTYLAKPLKNINENALLLAKGRRDISFSGGSYEEIVKINETLNYALEELNKTDTLQKELLANITHDLKTPLTLISGYAEMMKDLPDELNNDNLDIIVNEVKRLNLLVDDLLNLSKLQAKTITFNFEAVDLKALIEEILIREQKLNGLNQFEIHFNTECKKAIIYADLIKMSQVIYNYLTNAINYSGNSNQIDCLLEEAEDSYTFKVRDYGVGISESELSSIWNRYYRVDKTLSRPQSSSGLGLSIVKEILEAHHFTYGVTSKEGEGSTFYFTCPKKIENEQ